MFARGLFSSLRPRSSITLWESVTQLAKIGIAGHERGLLFNRERQCEAVYVIELAFSLDFCSLASPLGRSIYNLDRQRTERVHRRVRLV